MGLSLSGLLVLTVPFWVWPLDLRIQEAAWGGEDGWIHGEREPWRFLYRFGTWPALIQALAGLVVLALALTRRKWTRWGKVGAYLVLCMVIGPGLIVNLGLKDHWGRPRPREVIPFGGLHPPETVWIRDASSPGKSFPCGHCTMGFYFLAPGLVLWRQGRRRRALAVFGGALAGGLLLGVARILQGGHFASDVLWGGGICWLVALGLYHALRVDEDPETVRPLFGNWRPGPVQAGAAVLGVLLVAGILSATPYRRVETREFAVADGGKLKLSLLLEGGRHEVNVVPGGEGRVEASGQGHGWPGSAVKATWKEEREPGGHLYLQLKQRMSGWFTELDHRNRIEVPATVAGEIRIEVRSGSAEIDLTGAVARQEWRLEALPGAEVRWRTGEREGELSSAGRIDLVLPER